MSKRRARLDEDLPRSTGGQPGNQSARTHGALSHYVALEALQAALALPEGDLRPEILAARAVIQELLQSELDLSTRIQGLDRAAAALARLVKTDKTFGRAHDQLAEATIAVLRSMGLLGPDNGVIEHAALTHEEPRP